MDLPRRYSYHPKWTVILACGLFFGACSFFMGYKAVHNEAGVVINGILTFGPEGATVFYWVMSALGGMFVLMALLLAAQRVANPHSLELGTDAILLPHGFLQRKTSRIPYADIRAVSETEISGQTILYVITDGRKYEISASLLPGKASYAAVRDFLTRLPGL